MTETMKSLVLEHLGVTLSIRRIPQMLVQDWYDSLPPPPPVPTQEVDYGDGKKRLEANPSHPAYSASLEEYRYKIGMRGIDFAIQRGVVIDVNETAVAELREWAKRQSPPVSMPEDDKVLFVSRILVPELIDLIQIRAAVFSRFEPTQEAIDRAVDRFQSKVQGA